MDLELLSGLAEMEGDDDAGIGALMGALMGARDFDFAGDDDMGELMGALAGYNPELAMMMGKRRKKKKAQQALAKYQAQRMRSPFTQPTPLSVVQPVTPGVPDRGGRVQPLGFNNGAFTAAGPAVVTVRARPQRPIRGGRLVADFSRTGASATGLLTLVQLVVATDGQLLSGDPISFAALSPNAFGVGVNLSPAAVGNEITATVAISALPANADRVDFNLTLFGLTVG
jgi:hypothetical protein